MRNLADLRSSRVHRPLIIYSGVILIVLAAFVVKLVFTHVIGQAVPFLLFFGCVTIAAWLGGLRAGLLALVVSALLSDYFFLEPIGSYLGGNPGSNVRLVLFILECLLISLLSERLHRQTLRAALGSAEAAHFRRISEENDRSFRILVEAVHDHAMFTLSPDGQITSWNTSAERITGYTSREIVGSEFARFYTDRDSAHDQLRSALKDGKVSSEGWQIRRDGSQFWASTVISALRRNDGGLRGFAVVFRDRTEQKQLLDAQRVSEANFRVALKNSKVVVSHVDRDLRYTWIYNPHSQFGAEEHIGKRDDEIAPSPGVDRLMALKRRVIETGDGERERISFPLNASLRVLDITVEPLLDEHGEIIGVTTAAMDVTDYEQIVVALRNSEARLHSAVDSFPDVLVIYDTERRFEYANAHAGALTGLSQHQLIGQRDEDVFPQEVSAQSVSALTEVLATGCTQSLEIDLPDRLGGGSKIVNYAPMHDGQNRVTGVFGVFIDITARKRAEEALKESEEFRRLALEAAEMGTWANHCNGEIITWDAQTCTILGVPPGDAGTVRSSFSLVHPSDRQNVQEAFERALAANSTGEYDLETRIVRPDGSINWIATKGRVLYEPHGENSRPSRLIGVLMDITKRKQAEEALRESEERLRLAKLAAGIGIHDYNLETGIITWDEFTRDTWGVSHNVVITYETFLSGVHPDDREATQAAVDRVLHPNGTGEYYQEYRVINRLNAQMRWVAATGKVTFRSGRPVRLVGTVQDITERKMAEQALLEQRSILEQIINTLPVMITIYEPNSDVIYLNREFERLIGWSTHDTSNLDLLEAIYPDPLVRKAALEYMGSLAPGWRDFRLTARDGSLIETSWANILLTDGRHVGIGIDMRERKLSEQRANLLHAFAAALSTALTVQDVVHAFISRGIERLDTTRGVVALLSADKTTIGVIGATGYSGHVIEKWRNIPVDHPTAPIAAAVRKKAPQWIGSPEERGEMAPITQGLSSAEEHSAWAALPLIVNEEVIGVIGLGFPTRKAFDESERAFLSTLADHCAQALDRARLMDQTRELAAVEERQRLARDLHDAVSQVLFASSLLAEGVPQIWERDQKRAKACLQDIITLNRGALAEMRKLLLELRPEAIVRTSFGQLLDHLTRAIPAHQEIVVDLSLDLDNDGLLPPDPHVTLYRIAQEAMNNVAKHSQATTLKVTCQYRRKRFRLVIEDNGQGFDPKQMSTGIGLSAMRERAAAIGAVFKVVSKAGKGTRLQVEWKPAPTAKAT
ncbi:MAG: PAS domain S-box protein [Chloroflexi bacterium]|nr:PAS domain S-box protein [Chloroflexota bacterium]